MNALERLGDYEQASKHDRASSFKARAVNRHSCICLDTPRVDRFDAPSDPKLADKVMAVSASETQVPLCSLVFVTKILCLISSAGTLSDSWTQNETSESANERKDKT